jgi:hypothetical protein
LWCSDIRSFEKAKNRLLHISSAFTKDILIARFIGGPKEDIRHKVGVLEPDTLNVAYKYVLRYELDIEGQHKLAKTPSKYVASINYKEEKNHGAILNHYRGKVVKMLKPLSRRGHWDCVTNVIRNITRDISVLVNP